MAAGRKVAWSVGVAGVVIAFILAWMLLPLDSWMQDAGAWARGFGAAGVAVISAAYVLGTVLMIPGFPMTLAVAVIYGWWALAICFLGGMLAALISFLLGRTLARDLVRRFLDRHPAAKAVDSVAREEGFKTILLARLTPVTPFAMENYAFGVTSVRLVPFLVATAVGIVPGTVLNVWIGVIGRTAAQRETGVASWALLIVGLVAMVVLTAWMTREARRRLHAQRDGTGP